MEKEGTGRVRSWREEIKRWREKSRGKQINGGKER